MLSPKRFEWSVFLDPLYIFLVVISDRLQATLHDRLDLVESLVHSGALTVAEDIEEELTETSEQLVRQTARYEELQKKKLEEPGAS